MKCKVDVIVGGQHGDEGKGKVINELASNYDVNVRYQGGANSGHTIWKEDGSKVVFNVIPSGILNEGIEGVITQGVVINPQAFMGEVTRVGVDIKDIKKRLYISRDASITTPSHILIDIFTEASRSKGGKIIGSTNRGNTPTYLDKVARRGLRAIDLADTDFIEKYNALKSTHLKYIAFVLGATPRDIEEAKINGIPFDEYEKMWFDSVKQLSSGFMFCNTVSLLHEMCSRGKRILLEGAQGAMLDIEYGTYPFVTSSAVTSSAAFALTGIPPQMVGKVYMVIKPYVTRVGNGFFPTHITEDNKLDWDDAETIVNTGKEFGSVTARKRMIGWLDMPQLKYACMINGATDLILMKCDVLSYTRKIAVCNAYQYEGMPDRTDVYAGSELFTHCHMTTFSPLGDLSDGITPELEDLISYINDYVGDVITEPKITMVSMSATAKSIKI